MSLLLGACEMAPQVDSTNAKGDAPVIHDSPPGPSPQVEPDDGETLTSRIAKADIAFYGEIVDIEYRESTGRHRIPHTFVTYRIIDSALGGRVGDEVVLRFIGGEAANGRTLWVSDMPEFDPGDRDLMFVKDNGDSGCPLVGCTEGRLRVVDGLVYTDDGREVLLDSSRIKFGRLHELEAVLSNQLTTIVSEVLPDTGRSAGPSKATPIEVFLGVIRSTCAAPSEATGVGVSADAPFVVGVQVRDIGSGR